MSGTVPVGACFSPFVIPPPSELGLNGQKEEDEPGRSRLMSQNGSIVVDTPLEEIQVTMDHVMRCVHMKGLHD